MKEMKRPSGRLGGIARRASSILIVLHERGGGTGHSNVGQACMNANQNGAVKVISVN